MRPQLRRFILGDLLFIGVMIVLSDGLIALGLDRTVVFTATSTLILVALIVLMSALIQHRRQIPHLRRIMAGEYWAHWHYAQGEWRDLWSTAEMHAYNHNPEATAAGFARTVGMYTLSADAVGSMIGLFGNPLPQALQVGLITGGVVFVLSLLYALNNYRRSRKPLPRDAVDVYISRLGVCLPGQYIPLVESYTTLTNARIQSGEPTVLVLETQVGNIFSRSASPAIAIPIPRGRETEAQHVVERFQTEVLHR